MRENEGISGASDTHRFDEAVESSIDEKGRVLIPQHFVEWLGKSFIVSAVPKAGHLALFSERRWKSYVKPLFRTSPMDSYEFTDLKPFIGGLSARLAIDARGRITIPVQLRDLIPGRKIVFVGAFDTVRIYGSQAWFTLVQKMKQKTREK